MKHVNVTTKVNITDFIKKATFDENLSKTDNNVTSNKTKLLET